MAVEQCYRLELDGLTKRTTKTFRSKDIDAIYDQLLMAKESRLFQRWTLYWDGLIVREGRFQGYPFK